MSNDGHLNFEIDALKAALQRANGRIVRVEARLARYSEKITDLRGTIARFEAWLDPANQHAVDFTRQAMYVSVDDGGTWTAEQSARNVLAALAALVNPEGGE